MSVTIMKKLNRWLSAGMIFLAACNHQASPDATSGTDDTFIRGADLSFLPEIEQANTPFFTAGGTQKTMLDILQENGCNTVRVRLWYHPATGVSSLKEVAAFASRLKQHNLKLLLCIHYSDNWADPGKQAIPAAWSALALNDLADSVYHYTRQALAATKPEYVQIGNEINNGFLWEKGIFKNEVGFITLLKSGIKATRETSPATQLIIHFAGFTGADTFFSVLKNNAVDFDIAGLSYYPLWHGKSMDSLQTAMQNLVTLTQKPVMIAETSYPFTLGSNDNTGNIIGLSNQISPDFPASPQGQLDFMSSLVKRVKSIPKGIGFCYWGGEWVAFKGKNATDGSPYENQALFDFNNKALPVQQVFKK